MDGDDEKLWFARLNGGGFNPPCLAELKSSPSPSSPSSAPRSDPLLWPLSVFPELFSSVAFWFGLWMRCCDDEISSAESSARCAWEIILHCFLLSGYLSNPTIPTRDLATKITWMINNLATR